MGNPCLLFQIIVVGLYDVGLVIGREADCSLVDSGLEPIFAPCSSSVSDCGSAQNYSVLSKIFCLRKAKMQFDSLKTCTGELFADQMFGTLCGGIRENLPCYKIYKRNIATLVFKECNCASPSSTMKCPGVRCREALKELAKDIGCCTNGLFYTLPLDQCMPTPNTTLTTRNGLARLFTSCGLSLPSSCRHPFSMRDDASGAASLRLNVFLLTIILYTLLLASYEQIYWH